jgi:dolichol-phosphate mannosyltransferase
MTKKISILIPAYNEADNIRPLYDRLLKVLQTLAYDLEIIFVNDGSTDQTTQTIDLLAATDRRVKFIEFSRNFGKEAATTAALLHATGDAAIMLDSDLQHPPELIPQFLIHWERGADIVVGLRNMTQTTLIKNLGSKIFYRLMHHISSTEIIPNATDYRLLDRKVLDQFVHFTERDRITRGLIDWMGFHRAYINFDAAQRHSGSAKYTVVKLTRLAVATCINHCLFPLRFIGYLGVAITLFFGLFGSTIFIGKYLLKWPFFLSFSGPAQLAILLLFLVGILLSIQGILALYIASIQHDTSGRPLYLIRSSNLKSEVKKDENTLVHLER